MTPQERRNPDILKASRKKRIAAGSGTRVEDVNRLLKQHRQMADMMKQWAAAKRGGALGANGLDASALGGGMPQPTPEQIAALQKQCGAMAAGPAAETAGSCRRASCTSRRRALRRLPGLGGGKLPGLPAWRRVNPFGKKKLPAAFDGKAVDAVSSGAFNPVRSAI